MAKKNEIQTDEVSLASISGGQTYQDEMEYDEDYEVVEPDSMELISDMGEIEQLSEEAKKKQERALLAAREQAMATIDRKKLPLALKEVDSIAMYADILNDAEVLERVKENTKSAMDLKFLAEAQKIKLQNLQTLMRMDSVNTEGAAGEVFVGVEFGSGGGGTTKIAVVKR